MLEWLALIAVFAIVYRLRARVLSLEERADQLRNTITELRGQVFAAIAPA
jgi:hypothetical protein